MTVSGRIQPFKTKSPALQLGPITTVIGRKCINATVTINQYRMALYANADERRRSPGIGAAGIPSTG